MKKTAYPAFLPVCFCFFLLTACGIEDYPYLFPVLQGNISQQLNSQATVSIDGRNNTTGSPFYNFAIYYRIYISNTDELSPSSGNFANINPVLAQDYSAIASYINSTTLGNTSMGSLFQNRNYNTLELSDENKVLYDIENLLSGQSLLGWPNTVIFEFPQNPDPTQPWPYLTINGSGPYYLYRSTGNGRFNPMPLGNRYFMNYPDLNDPAYINSNYNADVVNINGTGTRYAYAAFFIVAVGLDANTFSMIYSTPAFVGVLKLPEQQP